MADVKRRPDQRSARQAAVKRRRKRRLRKYTLYYLAFIGFAVAAGVALSLTVFFKIDRIDVRGQTKYANGDLIDTAGIELGENLFKIDAGRAERDILAAYPYVDNVRVRRAFPSGVVIDVVQAEPVAALRYEEGYLLITREGKVLESALPQLPEGFTQVVGVDALTDLSPGVYLPDEAGEQLIMLNYLIGALLEVDLPDLDLIDLTDHLDMKLLYQNRLIIRLGTESELSYKLSFVKTIILEHTDDNFMGVLNAAENPPSLRYRDIFQSSVWPFGEELRGYYSGRPTVIGAGQGEDEEPEEDPDGEEAPGDEDGEEGVLQTAGEGQAHDTATEAASGGTGSSSGASASFTINGEPAERYEGTLPDGYAS